MIYIIFLSLIFGVILFNEKVKNLSSSSGGQTIGIYEGFFTKTRTHPSIKEGDKSSLGINVRCPIDAH